MNSCVQLLKFVLWSFSGVSFCMSLMFPTIYGIALGDLTEEQSKVGSAGLIMAIVGGAFLPMIQSVIIEKVDVQTSFIIPILGMLYLIFYGLKGYKQAEKS